MHRSVETPPSPSSAAVQTPAPDGSVSIGLLKALLAVSLVLPALVFAAGAWLSHAAAFRAAETRAHQIVQRLDEHASKTFETIELVLRQADERLDGLDNEQIRNSRPLWEEFRGLQRVAAQVASIFVTDPAGYPALMTRAFPSPLHDFSDRDYFYEQARADQGVFVGQTFIGRISSQPVFHLSIRRSHPDGRFAGVIGSSVFVTYFENFYATAGSPDDKFAVSLVRDDGEVLVRYPRVENHVRFAPDSPFLHASAAEGLFYAPSPVSGLERLYGYKKAAAFPVYAIYELEPAEIAAAWRRQIVPWALLTMLVGGFLFLTTWLALKRAQQEAVAVSRWHEEQKANQEREALFREVAHRVQNNMQLLVSMLSIQRSLAPHGDPDNVLAAAIERVRTMARLHSALFQRGASGTVDAQGYIEQLCADLRTAIIGGEPIAFKWDIGRVEMKLDQAVTVGLIISELVTNAVKHAFKGRQAGEIAVALSCEADRYRLSVADNGTGLREVSPGGFGEQLIRVLASQLHGELDVRTAAGQGSAFTIVFPVPKELKAARARA